MTQPEEPPTLSFIGTVDRAIDQDEATGDQASADVTVDELVGAPGALGDITGSHVVILLPEPVTVTVGESHLFRTTGVSYGGTITLRAIEILPADEAASQRSTGGVAPRLAAEVRRADTIVAGEIIRLGEPETSTRLTEHDPQRASALIRADETLAGTPQQTLEVMLPTSSDVMWADSASPREGESAVFMLRTISSSAGDGPSLEMIAVHPIETLDDIRSAVRES